jgi:hypothetical protein
LDAQQLLTLFIAALGGGGTVKLADIAYQEYRDWASRRSSSTQNIDQILEPLLKSADELVGKLRSLAEQDFTPIHDADVSNLDDPGLASLVYLFVQFWSQVEIARFRGMSTSVARSKRGKWTQNFLTCLESRRVRLIDRISQRALGEAVLTDGRTMNLLSSSGATIATRISALASAPLRCSSSIKKHAGASAPSPICGSASRADRHIGQHHLVTKDRPATPNKLNNKSWKDLNYRVFGVYLKFVANRPKYIGPPKRRP